MSREREREEERELREREQGSWSTVNRKKHRKKNPTASQTAYIKYLPLTFNHENIA